MSHNSKKTEVCRWITSLAGGSSCRETVGWLDGALSIQHSLRLKRPKMVRNQRPRRYHPFMSVDTYDDKVVSEYEED